MKKKILACVGILLATALLLGLLQALLVPKYMEFSQREGALIGEYYRESGDHDVLFVGDCEVYESFTPPTLWQEYGITSYIRGSAQQLIWQSYYLLEETFTRETPKAVVFNVLALKYGKPQNEAYNRMTLDGMEWSQSKIDAIYASMTEDETFLSYVFPLLRYHSRWSEIGGEDFQYLFSRDQVSHNGYLMQTEIRPKTAPDREGVRLSDYTFSDTAMDYLDRMRKLCEENGAEFILIKAPTNNWKYYWYDEWDEQVKDYAETYELAYYNMIEDVEEIGIDWSRDTYDGGIHLNVYGAEKLTSYFGKILQSVHGMTDRRGEDDVAALWDDKCRLYETEKKEMEQQR